MRPMGLADRYLWWKATRALMFATPAFVAAMILTHAQPVFEFYSRGMVDVGELLYLLLLWLPMMAYLSMPMILALSIGYAYAIMLQDREITALNAVGIPMRRLVAPGLVAALVGAIFCAAMSLYLVPESFLEFRERTFIAEKNMGPRSLRENQFTEVKPGVDVYFEERISPDTVRNIVVFIRDGGETVAVTGKTATFTRVDRRLNIVFRDGYLTRMPSQPGAPEPSVVRFVSNVQELARVYSSEDLGERGWGFFERHLPQLLNPPANENLTAEDRTSWIAEGLKRILHPILCIVYAMAAIAIALGSGYGRRTGMNEIVARIVVFLIALHPAYLVGIGLLSRMPEIDTRIVFLYPVALGAVAVWMLIRLDRRRPPPRARSPLGVPMAGEPEAG